MKRLRRHHGAAFFLWPTVGQLADHGACLRGCYGQPAVVLDQQGEAGSTYSRDPLDLVVGVL